MEQLSLNFEHFLPSLVVVAHEKTQRRIFEFFISQLPNDNTRKAYTHTIKQYVEWFASDKNNFTLRTQLGEDVETK